MISGTSYSPAKAFTEFAHNFFEALANEDFQGVLEKLDQNEEKWTRKKIIAELKNAIGEVSVCTPMSISKAALPELIENEKGYTLRHKVPVAGKWSKAIVTFRFVNKPNTGYYYVYLDSIIL